MDVFTEYNSQLLHMSCGCRVTYMITVPHSLAKSLRRMLGICGKVSYLLRSIGPPSLDVIKSLMQILKKAQFSTRGNTLCSINYSIMLLMH